MLILNMGSGRTDGTMKSLVLLTQDKRHHMRCTQIPGDKCSRQGKPCSSGPSTRPLDTRNCHIRKRWAHGARTDFVMRKRTAAATEQPDRALEKEGREDDS